MKGTQTPGAATSTPVAPGYNTRAGAQGSRVTVTIDGAHPRVHGYPLLPDDLLVRAGDGTWTKEAPGLAIGGFRLTPEQEATLEPVTFTCAGLLYSVTAGGVR